MKLLGRRESHAQEMAMAFDRVKNERVICGHSSEAEVRGQFMADRVEGTCGSLPTNLVFSVTKGKPDCQQRQRKGKEVFDDCAEKVRNSCLVRAGVWPATASAQGR